MKLRKVKHRWKSRPWTFSAWVRLPHKDTWCRVANTFWRMGQPEQVTVIGNIEMTHASLKQELKK